jgi:site-specific DNA recombinase
MFDLRARNTLSDIEIVAKLNKLGYRTRRDVVRDKKDRTKIIGRMGGKLLDMKGFIRIIQNPIYAGINCEKWTDYEAVKCRFNGIVPVATFNKANRGKIIVTDEAGNISIYKQKPPEFQLRKRVQNPDFPYKRLVTCPACHKPLFGSASRGKMGKYYPAYHCDRGHYFRIPKEEFDAVIELFVQKVRIKPSYINSLEKAVLVEWDKRQKLVEKDNGAIEKKITALKTEVVLAVEKIKVLSSETAIKLMEEDIVRIENQINELVAQKQKEVKEKGIDIKTIMAYIRYFLEHLDYLLLKQIDPIKKAGFFGVLFSQVPTFQDLLIGTQNAGQLTVLNPIFSLANSLKGNMEGPVGLEPTTRGLKGLCSNQLSYGPAICKLTP